MRSMVGDKGLNPTLRIRQPLAGRILVADDSPDLRELLLFQLGELGLEGTAVADGIEAIEAAARGGFDAILLDMEMPRMNGWEAAHALRAHGYDRPIIALTAHESGSETKRALAEGCNRILGKPCNIERLHAVLAPLFTGATVPGAPLQASAPEPGSSTAELVVRVDSRIADLAQGFLESARRDVAQARVALQARDLDAIRLIGHSLRGSAGSYGFEALARLGGLLEHAARNGDIGSADRIAARAADYLARVETRID